MIIEKSLLCFTFEELILCGYFDCKENERKERKE